MRTGKSLIELATDLQRRATAKVDYLADTREVGFVAATGKAALVVNHQGYETTAVANDQIAERTGIPIKYFDRMLENAPALLEANVRHWFAEQPERRMVRTLDGKARAFLSDRYRRIDNEEVAEAVLPILLDSGDDIRIESADDSLATSRTFSPDCAKAEAATSASPARMDGTVRRSMRR